MVGPTLDAFRRHYPLVFSLLLHVVGVGVVLWVSTAGTRRVTFGGPTSTYISFGAGAANGAAGTGPKAGDPKGKEGASSKKASQDSEKQGGGVDEPAPPKPKKLPTKAESDAAAKKPKSEAARPDPPKPAEKKETAQPKSTPAPPKKTETAKPEPKKPEPKPEPKKSEKVEKAVAKAPSSTTKKASDVKPVSTRKEVAAAPTRTPLPPWYGKDLRYNEALRKERGVSLGSNRAGKESRESSAAPRTSPSSSGGGGSRESRDPGDGNDEGPGRGTADGKGSGSTVIGAGGGVGGGGGLGVSGGPSLPEYYSRQAVASIAANFAVPAEDRTDKTCVVEFVIREDGSLDNVKIERSSGDDKLDRLALDAVKRTGRIAPLPDSLGNRAVEAVLMFSFVPE